MTTSLPGGGVYGRSARREVRNPILAMPEIKELQALPLDQRRLIAKVARAVAARANEQAEVAWKRRKGPMAAYYRATCTIAKHFARAILLEPEQEKQPANIDAPGARAA